MKLTDLALIFVVILLPVVIIVFVNTSFVLKSEKQELYYKEVIESAVEDAVISMKKVENADPDIDYGYSSIVDNKVSINADIAISTFYNSLFNTFSIKGNIGSEKTLKTYIPVIAIFDYDGIYIHSAELSSDGSSYDFVTKPKRPYSYSYIITKENTASGDTNYVYKSYDSVKPADEIVGSHVYEVNFTMDNYITLIICNIDETTKIVNPISKISFYLDDAKNIDRLIDSTDIPSTELKDLVTTVRDDLINKRKNIIAKICMQEIVYAANVHNKYAKMAGIKYNFRFTVDSDESFYETVDSIGMLALVQGISLGNRYLNYKAYGVSDLSLINKYYLTESLNSTDYPDLPSYYYEKLYHKSDKCEVYLNIRSLGYANNVLKHFTTKKEAATNGYHACPICKP